MENVSREAILNKTHYGTTIYSHILRKYYPGEIVMKIVDTANKLMNSS